MKTLAFALTIAFPLGASAQVWQPSPGHTQVPLWPGAAPGTRPGPDSESLGTAASVAGAPWYYVSKVSRPTLTVYSPQGENTGAAVLVFPGGGYQILAIDLEGSEVCDWLTARGITCILLKYRVPRSGPSWQADHKYINPHPAPALQDAQRAMGMVRQHAAEWHIDANKIGVLGFSAGGHLVAAISNDYQRRSYAPVDDADQLSCRPDFAVAVYPGHLWLPDDRIPLKFNPDIHVTAHTPPTILIQAETDSVDNVNQSLVYYIALKNAGVPVEMHLYTNGGHAFGLRRTRDPITEWPQLVEKWLGTIGITTEEPGR